MTRTAGIVALTLAVGLAGCQTVRNARARIERAPPRCQDETVPVYFRTGVAEPPADGRRALLEAARRAKRCVVKSVGVVGLADATGDAATNLELSRKRASAVSALIMSVGVQPGELQVTAGGDDGSVTPDGKAAPLRRRAEVTFHLETPK
jgi:outer membrane protein OmpA-like peptidoglycan-associated protein